MAASEPTKNFNGILKKAIDETIVGVVGQTVHEALFRRLEEKYSVTSDELPYRLDIMFEVLRKTFGVTGSRTIGRAIARNFFGKLSIPFVANDEYTLKDYLEEAKTNLAAKSSGDGF